MTSKRKCLIVSCFLIATAIGFGAFGAHILNPGLEEKYVRTLSTANLYFLFHGLGLLVLASLMNPTNIAFLKWSYWILVVGIVLFSGSLYAIVLSKFWDFALPDFVGPCTPFGGMLFIIGWLSTSYGFLKDANTVISKK